MSGQVLKFLQIICDVSDFDRVHKLGKAFCSESIRFFKTLESYVLVKGEERIPFNESGEYARINEKINVIGKSDEVIDEMVSINTDIEKLKIMINRKMLIPSSKDNAESIVLSDAEDMIKKADNYIFVVGKEKTFLSAKFEAVKLKEIVDRIKRKKTSEKDAANMAGLIKNLNKYIETGSAVSTESIQSQIEYAKMIMPKLKLISEQLYDPKSFPKTELVYSLLETEDEKLGRLDNKASVLYKFIGDVRIFLQNAKTACDKIEVSKGARYDKEKNEINQHYETHSFAIKNECKGVFGLNGDGRRRMKELEEEKKQRLKKLDDSIDAIVEGDKKLKQDNIKIIYDIDETLAKNIPGYKSIMA